MATAHVIRPEIEDDWQDLDSNLSVRSLPTSDDEFSEDEASIVKVGSRAPPPTAADTPTTTSSLHPDAVVPGKSNVTVTATHSANDTSTIDLPLRPATLGLGTSPLPTSQYPLSLSQDSDVFGRREEPTGPDDQDDQGDARSESSEGTVRDPSENPVEHHSVLENLAVLVKELREELQQTIIDLPSFNVPIVCKIQDALHVLSDHFDDLEPILAAYSKHWTRHGQALAADQIPLHTGLMSWMDSLEPCMIDLQGEVRAQAELAHDSSENNATTPAVAAAFVDYLVALEDLSETLTEFLPIMKLDFSEFQTKFMIFPECDSESNNVESRRQDPRPEIINIRRELYALKDQLQATSTLVNPIFNGNLDSFKSKNGNDALRAMETLDTLNAVISTSLTNTGSDWIESSISPNAQDAQISYPAFASLSPDILRDVASHLVQFREELDYDDDPEIEREFGKDAIRKHQIFKLAEDGLLTTLLATLDFLQCLLMGESLD
ncbi:unnamed protein product [Clonostachys chloroleuca]|uniref:Uncharacterized protein n=1 Tax=Clonostachys chloroleuca TaxID=1926264 RepID=A0AA35M432_9HYPO|nr:unnamed protein product [Clonostachys chloroleuca]